MTKLVDADVCVLKLSLKAELQSQKKSELTYMTELKQVLGQLQLTHLERNGEGKGVPQLV